MAARPKAPWRLLAVDSASLRRAVRAAGRAGLPVSPLPEGGSPGEALAAMDEGERLLSVTPAGEDPREWIDWAARAREGSVSWVAAVLGPTHRAALLRGLLRDVGVAALCSPEAAVAAAALLHAGLATPWSASLRKLPESDRLWMPSPGSGTRRQAGHWVASKDGTLSLSKGLGGRPLGRAEEVAEALQALRAARGAAWPQMPEVVGVDEEAVRKVLFGPPRTLSDPASKSALQPYGIPVPVERLCRSASRTAAEASRIRFPVRIALASPDLRIWEYPELVADGVDNAARAKEVFRQITTLARMHAPDARILGVTVSATTEAHCHLHLRLRPAPHGRVLLHLGFADPHGLAAGDEVLTVLPQSLQRLKQALKRLRGHTLLLPQRTERNVLSNLGDVLFRLGAFLHRWRREVNLLHIEPLAVLVGGEVEVREAAVTVSDAFEQDFYGPASEPR